MRALKTLVFLAVITIPLIGFGPYLCRAANQNWSLLLLAPNIYSASVGNKSLAQDIAAQVISGTSFSSGDRETKLIEEVNYGFINWLLTGNLLYEAFKSILPNGWSNNDTGIEIFIKFLQENPKYAEKFSEYLEIQSRRNDLKAEQACLTDKEIEAVIKNGVLVREWNSTVEINGTSWPCNYKEYVLEGEKTLTLLKMTIYTNETVVDPYITVNSFPLVAYIWPFGWLCFGEDWYLHIRAPYIIEYNGQLYYEAAIFVNYINAKVEQYGYVAIAIGALIGAALGAAGGPVTGAIEAAITALVTSLMVLNFQEEANLALVIAQGAAAQGNFTE
ncbi:MAG: hypothetical protein KIH08_13505 [Candidatus Freyarchaeota archaeon]|nr:hypothetical protein [Candidatus Jordarchaeia archaeon]MBS7269794.1 hypothetical protein [Candidatus Jordarchaeia archaeon]MBS7280081.1 hypothetical protein [Candidatus Jordarchaeia archaeon]